MFTDSQPQKHSFQAEVKQLMAIVINSLYSNKEIFLRELFSNASDAIGKLRFQALSNESLYENQSNLEIQLTYDKTNRTLTISDNGIGMSREEMAENLGTIAKSGTREFLSQLTGDQKKDAHLIGQFGVGFYSAFIVADKVTVKSRRAGLHADQAACWESNGDGEYTIETTTKATRGTDITLHLKEGEDEFLDDWRLRSIITKYSDHIDVPIMMYKHNEDENAAKEWEKVNRATALWTLPKNMITDAEYNEFYKQIAHDFDNPLAWTHHKIEGGNIEYSCLLYLPANAPFDLWQRDTHYGLKLYVQRVFIMDKVEQFLPNYLRFMRGVIDTTALPLNISREILQDHPAIAKLRAALVRHTLDLLEKLQKDQPEKYAIFWKEFGMALKEGPIEDFANRTRVTKLLRFASTQNNTAEQTVSLDDYISRMKDKQTKIYYITAENYNAAKASPHLEIFRKNNIEVLLLTDRIDEWLVGHLPDYEGKTLQSVAKGDLKLDEIIEETAEEKQAEEQKEKAQQQEFDGLLKKIKSILDQQIQEVRLSHRLIDSPACLVRDQNAIGPQMERLLKAAGQQVPEAKPILEINPEHKIIRTLQTRSDAQHLEEWTQILFEQALLAEGSALPDPAGFVQRINRLWMELSS